MSDFTVAIIIIIILIIIFTIMASVIRVTDTIEKHIPSLTKAKLSLENSTGTSSQWELEVFFFCIDILHYSQKNLLKNDMSLFRRLLIKIDDKIKYSGLSIDLLPDQLTYKSVIYQLYLDQISIIRDHEYILRQKKIQLLYKDDYGQWVFDSWEREMDYFSINILQISDRSDLPRYRLMIDSVVRSSKSDREYIEQYNSEFTGSQYEAYCDLLMESAGWQTSRTKSTGDQGVDIIAKRGKITIVIQCKHSKSSVGNNAVQEAIAARVFYNANAAIVVSNNVFTKSAKQLGQSSNVILINHEMIIPIFPKDVPINNF